MTSYVVHNARVRYEAAQGQRVAQVPRPLRSRSRENDRNSLAQSEAELRLCQTEIEYGWLGMGRGGYGQRSRIHSGVGEHLECFLSVS